MKISNKILMIIGLVVIISIVGGISGCKEVMEGNTQVYPKNISLNCPLDFQPFETTHVTKVEFDVERKGYVGISPTACLDYLRENYETPATWKEFDYICVLDNVLTNFEELSKSKDPNWWMNFTITGQCRCEYAKKI